MFCAGVPHPSRLCLGADFVPAYTNHVPSYSKEADPREAHVNLCEWARKSLEPEVFWVMMTAVFTLALFLVARSQLRDLARTSRTDLLYRLRKDFFNESARTITLFLDNEMLRFNPGPPACFDVVQNIVKTEITAVTTQWVDDYLGLLEDIAGLWKAKQMNLKEVRDSFGYYVTLVAEDNAIQMYVEWAREREGEAGRDIYEDLFDLHKAIKELETRKK
jgi:hypothetical protein